MRPIKGALKTMRKSLHRILPAGRALAMALLSDGSHGASPASPVSAHGAKSVDEIPIGPDWQYEPKWDGFRCLVFRDGPRAELQSKSGRPFTRYFPEIVAAAKALPASASCSTRDRGAGRTRLLVRRALAAHPPGREPHRAARRRDPGPDDRVRSAGWT